MENSNVYLGQMPKQQLMRLHRLLAIFAVILFGLMEAIVVTTVFGQKPAVRFPVAFLLPLLVAAPLAIAFLSYRVMGKYVVLSKGTQCDWNLVRFWWAILLVINYGSFLSVLIVVLR